MRKVFFVVHAGRPRALELARTAASGLSANGISVSSCDSELAQIATLEESAAGAELVVVFGGDGTILRGIEFARAAKVPVLGVNLGHVGFLAESEPENIDTVIEAIVSKSWQVEHRLTLQVRTETSDGSPWSTWALNEVALEKVNRERMADLLVSIDGRPLSRWACDGVLCSTPTGSTAYAFSAGGPVVWPEVEAMLVVPVSAHALFSRPLVVAPSSVVSVEVKDGPIVVSADGRRTIEVPTGAVINISRDDSPVAFARLHLSSFTERLVAKFELPVQGWRNRS
jgi:NAD+ kinase